MDRLPFEVLLDIFQGFDDYSVVTSLRPVCKSWYYAAAIRKPSPLINGLLPSIWQRILVYAMEYKVLLSLSQTCTSFRSLVRHTRVPGLQSAFFRLPADTIPTIPSSTLKPTQHPAFESICCRIETGSLIYHKTGNCCPKDLLSFPMADENATHPPVNKILVKFSSKYGVTLRPVLITKPQSPGQRGITVGDIYKAIQRLFIEPFTEKQVIALKQIKEREDKKHEANKITVARLERNAATTIDAIDSGALSSLPRGLGYTVGAGNADFAVSPNVALEEPIIEHDESAIYVETPFPVDSHPHAHTSVKRQREFLYDFPYVYASACVGGVVNGVQLFVLTYH